MTAERAARLRVQAPDGATFLASSAPNVRWLSGLAGEPHVTYGMAQLWVVAGPGGQRILAPAGELAWIDEQGRLDEDVIPHGRFVLRGAPPAPVAAGVVRGWSFADALAAALDAVGAGELLVADDGLAASRLDGLRADLAPRRLTVDPAPFVAARAVKDAAELDVLRRVNRLAEDGIRAALDVAAAGITERRLLHEVRRSMLDGGARPMLGSVGVAERGALVDFPVSDRVLAPGEVIRFDVGATLDGYHADLARTAVLGPPPAWAAEAYAAVLAGEQAALDIVRPGVTGEELFDAAVAATRAAGLPDYERTHCGHGIGLEMYEPPSVAPRSGRPLAAGTTLCLETPLYLAGQAGIQVEDAIVITADGYERLGAMSRDLVVV